MSVVNDFVPFCPTDTGTNLDSQSDYLIDPDRTIGNQPGVASSKLNNKALRQATYIASQIGQLAANFTQTNLLDNNTPAQLLAQLQAMIVPLAPTVTSYLTAGSATHNLTQYFFVASASATIGATYTNNGITYTVKSTIAAATVLQMTGNGAPTTSGTLTKTSGTGDSSIVFYTVRAPLSLNILMSGAGGGGSGSGTSPGSANAGGNSTFGTSLLVANGGAAAVFNSAPGVGGTASLGTGPLGLAFQGGGGGGAVPEPGAPGGSGGSNSLGGAGQGSANGTAGTNASTNSGAGGGGASSLANSDPVPGGGSGGFVNAFISASNIAFAYSYPVVVGAKGTGGTAGGSGFVGGNGADGIVLVTEHYQ